MNPLLLPWLSLAWLSLAWLGCRAEDLGVEVPRGGIDTISQEDLQRDVSLLVTLDAGGRGPGSPGAVEAAAQVERRLRQMHTLPAFGRSHRRAVGGDWTLCGLREGRSSQTVVVLAIDGGQGADLGASPVAVMLSLAKGGDVPGRPISEVFCRLAPQGGLKDLLAHPPVPWSRVSTLLLLGPLGGDDLQVEPLGDMPAPAHRATTGPDPVHGGAQDVMERLDYRVVERHTRDIFRRFLQP